MATADIDEATLFDFPWFQTIVEFLDVPSALHLRGTCRAAREACSSRPLSAWRHGIILPAMKRVHGPPPPGRPDWGWTWTAPLMTDIHLCWLFDNSSDVEAVDLGDAPFPTDVLLEKIASECPNLKSFSVTRGQDGLRLHFDVPLQGLTTDGVMRLIAGCPRLEYLCLSWCEHVEADVVCRAISQSPARLTLRYLNLDGMRVSDLGIRSLAVGTSLKTLCLQDTIASDLSPLAACRQLETLHLCRGRRVQPGRFVVACSGFKDNIRVLCCAGCGDMDEATALRVLEMCPRLEVWNCVRGTPVGREALQSAASSSGRDVCFDRPSICSTREKTKSIS